MEDLISDSIEPRLDFEVFKSNICHLVKDNGDIDFIITALRTYDISSYWSKKWYAEAFYLLATVDYLSRLNNIPLCSKYNDIRAHSLAKPLYPRDIILSAKLSSDFDIREKSKTEAIPEFLRFNIVESEVRNVY